MKITDEQIEKAADAAFHAYCNRGDASAYTWWRDVARAALEAVMPEGNQNGPDWEGFGRAVMADWPEGGDLDGFALQDMAVEHGLLREVPGGFRPEEHIDVTCCAEPGDVWFEKTFPSNRGRLAHRAALEEVMPGEPSFWMVQDAEGRTMYIGGPANKGYAHNTAKHIGGTVYALYAHPAPEPGEPGVGKKSPDMHHNEPCDTQDNHKSGDLERLRAENERLREAMWKAHFALDANLGDSDMTHYETDDELREDDPVQWAAMVLASAALAGGGRDE